MMKKLIDYIKGKSIHTPRLAIVRFLLGLGLVLTLFSNDLDVIANHKYVKLHGYSIRHDPRRRSAFDRLDLFIVMPPQTAKTVVIVIMFLVMSGFLPQVTGILHLWASFSLHNYMTVYNGGDDLAFILSGFLLPICLTDPRINTWKRKEIEPSQRNIVSNIALAVIQIQAAVLYFDAGFAKMFTPQWQDGTAIYYYTSHYRLGAPDWLRAINETMTLTPFVKVLTWGTLAFEMVLVLVLFFPPNVKSKFMIPAIIFHLLIVINFGLITFFISILALLILYLDDLEYSVKILNWLTKPFKKLGKPATT